MESKKVFLSYASADRPVVERLRQDLAEAGVAIWIDYEALIPGSDDWGRAIARGIPECQALIYIASPQAQQSPYVVNELELARKYHVKIIPFWIAGSDWIECVPFGFSRLQFIDARANYGAALARLLPLLVTSPSQPPAPPAPQIVRAPATPPVDQTRATPPSSPAPVPVAKVAAVGASERSHRKPSKLGASIIVASVLLVGALVLYSTLGKGLFMPARASATHTVPASPAHTVLPATPPWTIAMSPNPRSGNLPSLVGVATWGTSLAWAVGSTGTSTLIERWNGSSWSIVPSPSPGFINELQSVAVVDATSAWAVGDDTTVSGAYQTLIEKWDGTKWSMVPSPSPGTADNFLSGIAVTDASHAWAVGSFSNTSQPQSNKTLVEEWDGTKWSMVASPSPGFSSSLYSAAALDASHVWAVGGYTNDITGDTGQPLIERWDGTTWSQVQSPNPKYAVSELLSVAVVDTTYVWAAGYTSDAHQITASTLIEQWNGAAWTIVPSPSPSSPHLYLSGIAALDATHAWAVGQYVKKAGSSQSQSFIEGWNGKSWSIVPNPNPGTDENYLNDIAMAGSSYAWAVGEYDNSPQSSMTLIERN